MSPQQFRRLSLRPPPHHFAEDGVATEGNCKKQSGSARAKKGGKKLETGIGLIYKGWRLIQYNTLYSWWAFEVWRVWHSYTAPQTADQSTSHHTSHKPSKVCDIKVFAFSLLLFKLRHYYANVDKVVVYICDYQRWWNDVRTLGPPTPQIIKSVLICRFINKVSLWTRSTG